MLSKSNIGFIALSVLSASEQVLGRQRWLERDGRPVSSRSFGNEHPAVIDKLSVACPGEVCGVLAGQAITPLLGAQGECTQQDLADAIIGMSNMFICSNCLIEPILSRCCSTIRRGNAG